MISKRKVALLKQLLSHQIILLYVRIIQHSEKGCTRMMDCNFIIYYLEYWSVLSLTNASKLIVFTLVDAARGIRKSRLNQSGMCINLLYCGDISYQFFIN